MTKQMKPTIPAIIAVQRVSVVGEGPSIGGLSTRSMVTSGEPSTLSLISLVSAVTRKDTTVIGLFL